MHIERKLHVASLGESSLDKDIYVDQFVWDENETIDVNDAVSYLTPITQNFSYAYILIVLLRSYPIDWKIKNVSVLRNIQNKYSIPLRSFAENIVDTGNCATILACGCARTEKRLIDLLLRESLTTRLFLSNQEYDAEELLELLSNNVKKLPMLSGNMINAFCNKDGVLVSSDSWIGESAISVFYSSDTLYI